MDKISDFESADPRSSRGGTARKNHLINMSARTTEWFIENSKATTLTVKKYLIRNKILKDECSECQLTEWNRKSISLHLDHKNGINNDFRLENLRLLCPNCHSLTETYGGKNKKIIKKIRYKAPEGWQHRPKPHTRKVERPSKEDLEILINEIPMTTIGKKYGVSDNSIRKWCKMYKIEIENRRGYWAKKNAKKRIS